MGRKASHVALECALQSHPNMVSNPDIPLLILGYFIFKIYSYSSNMNNAQVILGEEVSMSKLTIFDITKQICDAVQARAEKGRN
jgi:diphosphate-dependent phosphofructokinase